MGRPSTKMLLAVFFCTAGWVCSSQVFGADGEAQAEPVAAQAAAPEAADAKAPATQPAGVFENKPAPKAVSKKIEKLPEGQSVNVGSFGNVELHVKDADLTQVLQLLSIQSQRNIVATKNVSGAISADLYGVDFYEALDAILHTNGFGYREKGNFIYVYTLQEIKAIEEADRKMTSKVLRLNYITAHDAATFVEPLKSAGGSIAATGQTSAGFVASTSDGGANSNAHGDTVVIRDFPENVDAITAVLKDLDVRPKQVLIEASVLQAKLDEENAFGVDMTIIADFAMADFAGGPLSIIDQLLKGAAGNNQGGAGTSTVGQTASGNSSGRIGIVSQNIAAFIKALDSVTDTTVLANPKLLVLNRQKANLLVGERLGYISSTASETSTTQTVQFLDVGTQLNVRPFVSDDGFVRMELQPRISDGSTKTVGSFVIPNETTQELTTNVMVRSGQTVVLGGLFKEDTVVGRRQVPGLGDIPVVGLAFKGQDDTVTRNEVIFLVTPTIMKDESLYASGDRVKESFELARVGARQGLLPWSKSKLAAAHMRDAVKYQQDGNKDKALWATNMALTVDPTSPEAMRLKEQLTGQRTYWPERSIMKNSIDDMVKKQVGNAPAPKAEAPAEAAETTAAATTDAAAQTAAVETDKAGQ